MSERDATDGGTDEAGSGGRDLRQALVAVAVVVGLVTAAAMIPALSASPPGGGGSGDGNSERPSTGGGTGLGGNLGGSPAQPGALNPGERTGVGGSRSRSTTGSQARQNLSDEVHFTVDAQRASYWRTGSYDRYTGSGWVQTGSPEPYTGPIDATGRRLVQEVTLRQGATGLPSAWQPSAVLFPNRADPSVLVMPGRALAVPNGVPEGTTYQVISRVQMPRPETLRRVGTDPSGAVEKYTELPPTTPDRLERFTSNLTRQADGAYETARMIELWLENNKRYSLNASHDTSRPVASQFVFEMDKGYCEYFATSMVAMLRTQDVPARYVVGYAPGVDAGNGTYRVRAKDAHAWVEVYFQDVGWVRFDPTPAASRRATERSAGDSGEREPRPIVPGSPGDFGGNSSVPPVPGTNGTPTPPGIARGQIPPPPYDVSLNATPVPGSTVTATVTKDGRPIEGVYVTFEGERVGRTNRNGNVTATVPYVDDLTVSVELPKGVDPGDDDEGTRAGVSGGDRSDGTGATAPALQLGSVGAGAALPRSTDRGPRQTETEDGDSERTYDVTTDVTVRVEGTFAPGRSPEIVATIDDVPVRNARVTFGGEYVGRTDRSGRVRVDVPESARGTVDVGIRRGEVSETASLSLETIHVRLYPDTVLPLPGQGATIRVTVGDTPIPRAPVYVDGDRIGTTGADGTVRTTLPTANSLRIRAEGPVLSKTSRVGELFLNLGVLVGSALAFLAGAVVLAHRRGPDPGDAAASIGATLRAAVRALAAGLRTAVDGAVNATILAGRYLAAGGEWALEAGRTLLARVASVSYTALAVGAVAGVRRGLGSVWRWIRGLPGRVWRGLVGFGSGGSGSGSRSDDRRDGRRTDEGTRLSDLTVRAAWRAFVRMVPVSRPRKMTPGEIRRRAVDAGFPERPVSRLTDAFRDVEYGGREETERRREAARTAVREVENEDRGRRGRGGRPGGDD